MSNFFKVLDVIQGILWGYVDFLLILIIGLYFSLKTKFFQVRSLFQAKSIIKDLLTTTAEEKQNGITPIRLYFSSVGGSIGLGNVISVVTTVTIGGPGGLFWMWIAAFLGMLVKYSETYLGILYRKKNANGGYDGGPFYYFSKAFKSRFFIFVFCIFMCIYGVEIYQFKVIEDIIVDTFSWNRYLVIAVLLAATIYVTLGGINRLSIVCTTLMPIFIFSYIFLCIYVISQSEINFLNLLGTIFKSAFTGHAAVGGFAGSTFIIAAQYGMSNSVYSGDIGIGYDSVIQAETQLLDPKIQSKTVLFTLLTDCFICTLTIFLVLSSGAWKTPHINGFDLVLNSLKPYFPGIQYIMAVFFFIVGWTTILSFLAVGRKSAQFLGKGSQKAGNLHLVYALVAFFIFSFIDQSNARLVMGFAGGVMILINLIAIFRLREKIDFS